jgi:2,4-dienoyl-CoA reductase-like NADH-dependent reductase (Old Yellow Enzyme family)
MFDKTFSPITFDNLQLPNRIVFAPFETNFATGEGYPTDRQIDYYGRMAEGGTGFLIVEATNVNPEPGTKGTPFGLCLHHDGYIDPLAQLVDRIHSKGGKAALQLVDKSLKATQKNPDDLTVDEIERIADYFADGAVRTRKAGFDAIDFHMAHSYTVGDFLSRRANHRQDDYGRTLQGRTKMSLSILKKTREKVGNDYTLMCRINGDEFIAGGNTLLHGMAIAQKLVEGGADIIDVSAGVRRDDGQGTYSILRGVPTPEFPDGCNVHVAEGIKKAIQAPVITVGKIRTPQLVEEILQAEKADLVGLSRPLFADPLFPRKAREGRCEEIVTCLCCNYCHRLYLSDKPVECVQRIKKKG